VHELVIIETGHIDARFKHEVWNTTQTFKVWQCSMLAASSFKACCELWCRWNSILW